MTESTQTTVTADDYLNLLEKSSLLSPRQMKRVRHSSEVQEQETVEDLARLLVRKRVLTPFQAERLLEGRYRGFLIDGYRIREILGVGGMGCVFIAEEPDSGEKVALKVLSSQHATDAGMLARMKLEAWAGMQVQHPNVVPTRRMGSTGAVTYLVMDLLRAISLHEMVALGGPVRPDMAADMFLQAAQGLQAAHDRNIIHRDIKPANLLIDHDGHTSILDFGLALVGDDTAAEFSLAMIFGHDCLGTPDYIAPEQSLNSNDVDGRADVYSLGCTFYVALTGRVPFADCKTNREKLDAQRNRTPPQVHDLRPEVPEELSRVVARMMAREPDRRYQTPRDVARALRPFAKRRPVKFDFRRLVTIRARMARQKELAENKSRPMSRSYITASLSWVDNSSHHLDAGADTFAGNETPAVRQPDRRAAERDSGATRSEVVGTGGAASARAPRGWYVQSLRSRRKTSLKRSRNRVGRGADCEVRVTGRTCDDLQCLLEHDGEVWKLKQESLSFPTYVDGKLDPYAVLKPGSRVTFQDGSGFVLRHLQHGPHDSYLSDIPLWMRVGFVAVMVALLIGIGWIAWALWNA